MDTQKLADSIVMEVGGTKNIKGLIHCVTRLRFYLIDESKANTKEIEALEGVISVVKSGGQYQVVIGNQVSKVFDAIMAKYDINGDGQDTNSQVKTKIEKNWFNRFMALIVAIVSPAIPAIAVAGILKGLLALLTSTNMLSEKAPTYIIMYAIADAMFYFLPIIVGITTAKHFHSNQIIGAGIGASLVYPTIVNAFNAKTAMNLFGIPVILANYTSSLFPAIFAVWLASIAEHYLEKHITPAAQVILVPLFSYLVGTIPTFLIAGPILSYLSKLLSVAVIGIYNFAPVLAGILLGAFWQVMVVFGLHYAFIPILMNNITTMHQDPINAILGVTVFAQFAVALGIFLKAKNKKNKEVAGAAAITAFLGVTEPAIYGCSLKYKKAFAMSFIGGGVGGAIMALMNARTYAFGSNAIFAAPLYINPKGIDSSFWAYIIADLATIIITVVLVMMFGYTSKDDKVEPIPTKSAAKITLNNVGIISPVKGKVESLTEVNDPVFSSGTMGTGFAVIPNSDEVRSPINGTVSTVFDTKHAVGLISDNGVELLIHMGIDTVNLKGKYFSISVKKGDKVKKGQLIANVQWDGVKKAGYDTTTMVIVTNSAEFKQIDTNIHNENNLSNPILVIR
ncbi:beta-glucoside-specific PTS transporter subunit IIABC [Lactobacillus sp. B4005]|uniref:beta-glucoside-specific PTS transporter subunit IIABC n=1 Tax=Lactobacillus sp. B4005 TaxID=2818031 RepID=UPI00226A81D7|nr:beta-glucoside-specific PTS transporter subunit IIABC [Lactobacillus sp. B4005]MCX8723967.1 PTS glucose transporter subunit IIA [Lactobacillus sp. B4005]